MRMTIIPEDQTIIKDGEALQFSFVADPNIHAIQWYDTYGTIEYKSGPAEHPMMGVFRHADAGYELAQDCAARLGVKIPMA